MNAHISWAKLPEFRLKRLVCSVDDAPRFMMGLTGDDITDLRTGMVFRAGSPDSVKNWGRYPLVYDIPGGPLKIVRGAPRCSYDGHPEQEIWPTSSRRQKVVGPHLFDVDSFDDSLCFVWTDTPVDLRRAIIGFRLLGGFDGNAPA